MNTSQQTIPSSAVGLFCCQQKVAFGCVLALLSLSLSLFLPVSPLLLCATAGGPPSSSTGVSDLASWKLTPAASGAR